MTGLVINATFDSSVTSAANASQIEAAVNSEITVLENLIATPLTLNLNVGWGEAGGTALTGGALDGRSPDQYVTAANDIVANAFAGRVFSPGLYAGPATLAVPLGAAMALGLADSAPITAAIGFSSTAAWDFTGGPPSAAGAYDLQGAIANEITAVLGRTADASNSPSLLDYYRYASSDTIAVGAGAYGVTFFSTNNGETRGPDFLPNSADWDPSSSVPDAFAALAPGVQAPITQVDLNELRALGFDLINTTDYSSVVTQNYENYLGREPTSTELATWQTFIHGNADVATLQGTLASDYHFENRAQALGEFLYSYYALDDYNSNFSLGTVEAAIASGQTAQLRDQVISSASGQAYSQQIVSGLYDIYFGRDPSASELATWNASLLSGDGYDAVRATLVGSAEGQGHTDEAVTQLYEAYLGRDPTSSELTTWRADIANPTADFNATPHDFVDVYYALVTSTDGEARAATAITNLYDTYMGRDPTQSEIHVWQESLANIMYRAQDITHGEAFYDYSNFTVKSITPGMKYIDQGSLLDEYNIVKVGILNDYYGNQHTITETTSLYDTYFGRDPTSDELSVWTASLKNGATFDQMRDQLERESTASNVQHVVVASHPTSVAYGTGASGQYLTIDQFDPAHDTVSLSNATYGGINPLDSSHALQITATTDGTIDVLVTLDATHSILFEHTTLASLQTSDFVFA